MSLLVTSVDESEHFPITLTQALRLEPGTILKCLSQDFFLVAGRQRKNVLVGLTPRPFVADQTLRGYSTFRIWSGPLTLANGVRERDEP